ncbi:Threonine synthase [Nitrospira japonica]|uniref:Threonine synthase n=1 Tax=Nitrospira japonica TaxID=1325564 RepID=A0A1W1I1R3_9BACT|nr:threonine synthase [Nitrospira japonica]SLM46921.1 Threonine synthase [Nitrospira japonica]
MKPWRGLIEEYRKFLPVTEHTPVVSLGEGHTPLIRAAKLAKKIAPGIDLYLKVEGANPTGSFKDRGMTMAISKALEGGAQAVICASTGNTSASAAAYGARAGLAVYVLIPAGKIAMGKLSQAMMHQATVIQIDGNFDQALSIVKEVSALHHIELVNSLNPYRIEGQKTAAMEVCDQLGDAPTLHVLPVGNAGNITAYWKGYQEYRAANQTTRSPRMMGFQAAGAAPMVLGHIVENPQTVATAIRIGNPASWQAASDVIRDSSGFIDSVLDEEILQAYTMVAGTEGVFCEPASAASVAGVIKLSRQGALREGDTVVCTLTGHGLKDADTAISVSVQPKTVQATKEDVARFLKV